MSDLDEQSVLVLPELDYECETCQGNGIVTSPVWQAWRQRELAAEAAWKATPHPGQSWYSSAEFDENGQHEPDKPEIDCLKCGGRGTVLTDAGRDLLRFLQRHPPAVTRT